MLQHHLYHQQWSYRWIASCHSAAIKALPKVYDALMLMVCQ